MRLSTKLSAAMAAQLELSWLWLSRLVWAVLLLGTLTIFAVAVPARYQEIHERYRPQLGLNLVRNRAGEPAVRTWLDGPAQRAGILEGDRLVAVNGQPVLAGPGAPLDTLLPDGRAGAAITLSVRTGDHPARDYVVIYGGVNALALAGLGLSPTGMAAFAIGVELLTALAGWGIAAVIVWRRRGDGLALVISLSILATLLSASLATWALHQQQPFWRPVLEMWLAFALTAWLVFFCLFPDGSFMPRWTLALLGLAVAWLVAQWLSPSLYPWRMAQPAGILVLFSWLAAGVVAQVYRYARHSSRPERQQTKWVVLGSAAGVLGLLLLGATLVWPPPEGTATVMVDLLLFPAAQLLRVLLPVTIFIAILRYRLWDIDLILNRTLVYGGLTASVIAIYVLSVGVIGALIQSGLAGLGSVLATGLVALLVQPLRDRLQRGVNRLMYGERDDPVTVLSRLGQKLEAVMSPEALLPALAETVAQALKLPYVAIELGTGDTAAETVTYPADHQTPRDLVDLSLVHQGETVGRLRLAPRAPGEPFSPLDRHLVDNIARQAGLAVHAVGLTRELQRARQRSVAALEEERRRLRRDLHDGLGPALASQGLKLAAIKQHLVGEAPVALALIDNVLAQNHETVADVRRLIYGLRPPALDERGLAEAIRDQLGHGGTDHLQITVNDLPANTPPLPAAVEVAAYRIALEALTNVQRHARARQAAVRFALGDEPAALQVEIEDDGAGLSDGLRAGVGLRSMRERAEELGGRLSVAAGARGGTCVRATLPLTQIL
jgi:signal transduction histidine kinase